MLESGARQLDDRWPIFEIYFDYVLMSKDGELRDIGLKTLARSLRDDPADVEGVSLMTSATQMLSSATSRISGKLKGCKMQVS